MSTPRAEQYCTDFAQGALAFQSELLYVDRQGVLIARTVENG